MKKKDNIEKQIIDKFYDEASNSSMSEKDKFADRMEQSLAKMDVLKDLDFPIGVNILEIISKGEEFKEKRKTKYELVSFSGACLLILSVFTALLISGDPKIYLYIYAAISVLLPLVIIPVAAHAKGEA